MRLKEDVDMVHFLQAVKGCEADVFWRQMKMIS